MMMAADGYYTLIPVDGFLPMKLVSASINPSQSFRHGHFKEIVTSEKSFVMAVSKKLKDTHSLPAFP